MSIHCASYILHHAYIVHRTSHFHVHISPEKVTLGTFWLTLGALGLTLRVFGLALVAFGLTFGAFGLALGAFGLHFWSAWHLLGLILRALGSILGTLGIQTLPKMTPRCHSADLAKT